MTFILRGITPEFLNSRKEAVSHSDVRRAPPPIYARRISSTPISEESSFCSSCSIMICQGDKSMVCSHCKEMYHAACGNFSGKKCQSCVKTPAKLCQSCICGCGEILENDTHTCVICVASVFATRCFFSTAEEFESRGVCKICEKKVPGVTARLLKRLFISFNVIVYSHY